MRRISPVTWNAADYGLQHGSHSVVILEVGRHLKPEKKLRFASIPAGRDASKSNIKGAVELDSLLLYTSTNAQNGASMDLLWTLCENGGSTNEANPDLLAALCFQLGGNSLMRLPGCATDVLQTILIPGI